MPKLLALAVMALLAACGSEDDPQPSAANEPAETTTTAEPTTTTVDPETAFLDKVYEDISGASGAQFEANAISFGRSLCDTLDAIDGVFADDAPNDSPETDAQVADELTKSGLDLIMDSSRNQAVSEVVMRAAGAELCPEHYRKIVVYLNTR